MIINFRGRIDDFMVKELGYELEGHLKVEKYLS